MHPIARHIITRGTGRAASHVAMGSKDPTQRQMTGGFGTESASDVRIAEICSMDLSTGRWKADLFVVNISVRL